LPHFLRRIGVRFAGKCSHSPISAAGFARRGAAAEPRFGAKQPPLIAGIFADCRNLCGALPVNT
jgi:hypothetical protein